MTALDSARERWGHAELLGPPAGPRTCSGCRVTLNRLEPGTVCLSCLLRLTLTHTPEVSPWS